MAAAVGLAAPAAGIGDGTTSKIAQTGDLLDERGAPRFEVWQGFRHW